MLTAASLSSSPSVLVINGHAVATRYYRHEETGTVYRRTEHGEIEAVGTIAMMPASLAADFEDPMMAGAIDVTRVLKLVRAARVPVQFEMTGGGCGTIYAGEGVTRADGGKYFPCVAGACDYESAAAHVSEFAISTDDEDGDSTMPSCVQCEAWGISTEEEIAAVIIAQARKPLGVALSQAEVEAALATVRA